jgi:hypothetical protein
LDLDPGDLIVDEDCVLDLGGFVQVPPNRFCDQGLDLVCRDPAYGPACLARPCSRVDEM